MLPSMNVSALAAVADPVAEMNDLVITQPAFQPQGSRPDPDPILLTPGDLESFCGGRHFRAYDKLGAHLTTVDHVAGTFFAVWAPNAQRVQVIGDFNDWNREAHPLQPECNSG